MQPYKAQMGVFKNLLVYVHANTIILVEVSKNNQSQVVLKITLATLRDAVTTCASEMVNAGVPVSEALTGQAARKITTCNQVLTPVSLTLIFHFLDGNGAETSLIPLCKLLVIKSSTTFLIFGKPRPDTNLDSKTSISSEWPALWCALPWTRVSWLRTGK